MNRSFTPRDAQELIATHEGLLRRLQEAIATADTHREHIQKAAETYIEEESRNLLREISVEELNHGRKGIRVKLLIDHNIKTMADVLAAPVRRLSAIKGISEETAYHIKRIANSFAVKARGESGIRLNADDRSSAATALVQAISVYKNSKPYIEEGKTLLEEYEVTVVRLVAELKPSVSKFRWFFSSGEKKRRALTAYEELDAYSASDCYREIQKVLAEIKKHARVSGGSAWEDFTANTIQFHTILEEIVPTLADTGDAQYGLPEELADALREEPFSTEGLFCTLRQYQELGVKYILHQGRVLLGDEMGLGKTVQAIAVMVSLRNAGATHFAVICPASVVTNWQREILKHSDLSVIKVHGADKESAYAAWVRDGGVAVTTYETTPVFKMKKAFSLSLAVVDEAHYIKNPEAKRTISTRALCAHAERLLFMTGTALENRVDEMVELISVLQPDVAKSVEGITFLSSAPQFRKKIAPVYYRRRREDVLTELPELIENRDWCTMTPIEERVYDAAILGHRFADARRVSWNIDDLSKSSKANRLLEIVEAAKSEERKVIVFSFFLDTIDKITVLLSDRCYGPINGSVPPQKRQEIIDAFERGPAGSVLLAQIQSGGTGLNIQSASVVVICEPQFKPSIENQAIARAYRMGQSRNVLVHRLLCEDTVDERIIELLEEKQALFDAFADESLAAEDSFVVDDKAFGSIIADEFARIQSKKQTSPLVTEVAENTADEVAELRDDAESVSPTMPSSESDMIAEEETLPPSSPAFVAPDYGMMIRMSYEELTECLLRKYGMATCDYFADERCTVRNAGILRTAEGLVCHHLDEDRIPLLSNEKHAGEYPFSYQRADRLVYCNLIEHLLLHIKIAEKMIGAPAADIPAYAGAIRLLVRRINDYYNGEIPDAEDMRGATAVIKDEFDDYIAVLRHFAEFVTTKDAYGSMFAREDLACGWRGNVVASVLRKLNN